MGALKRLGLWFERVTAPPARPQPPNILSHPEVTRTFVLHCPENFFGAMPWHELPPHVVENLVAAFNTNGDRVDGPYVQFYADARYNACVTGIAEYDEAIRKVISHGTFSSARGKIRPTASTVAKIDDDMASITFTSVRLEFTVNVPNERELRDMVLSNASIEITPTGQLLVTKP